MNAAGQQWFRRGDASPHRLRQVQLPAGRKLRRADGHAGKSSFVVGGNGVNPMAGSALQHVRRVREEKTVEVVENHEGGTRSEMASRSRRRRALVRQGNAGPGVDSRAWDGGGAIFGNPKRGRSGRKAGSIERMVPGKSAPRSGGSGTEMREHFFAPSMSVLAGHPPEGGQGHGGLR